MKLQRSAKNERYAALSICYVLFSPLLVLFPHISIVYSSVLHCTVRYLSALIVINIRGVFTWPHPETPGIYGHMRRTHYCVWMWIEPQQRRAEPLFGGEDPWSCRSFQPSNIQGSEGNFTRVVNIQDRLMENWLRMRSVGLTGTSYNSRYTFLEFMQILRWYFSGVAHIMYVCIYVRRFISGAP